MILSRGWIADKWQETHIIAQEIIIVREGITAIGEAICKTTNREHGREN